MFTVMVCMKRYKSSAVAQHDCKSKQNLYLPLKTVLCFNFKRYHISISNIGPKLLGIGTICYGIASLAVSDFLKCI